jgi:hypothetical protein
VMVVRSGRVVAMFEGDQVTVHSLTRAALGVDAADLSLSHEPVGAP